MINVIVSQEVTNTHVNLIDLLHVHGTDLIAERFPSVYELSEYTMDTKKIFPKENANAGNMLKYLLRHIFHPEQNEFHRKSARGGKGRKKGRGRKGPK